MGRSRHDDAPVFDAMLKNAITLFKAQMAGLILATAQDAEQSLAALHGMSPELRKDVEIIRFTKDVGTFTGRTALRKQTVYVEDIEADPDFEMTDTAKRGNFQSTFGVPLVKDEEAVGVITLGHAKPGAF